MAEGMAVPHTPPLAGASDVGATGRTNHVTYAWQEGTTPGLLVTEAEIHAARDVHELREFPGVPDTDGETFVVNCPVPVLAENTFHV
jgi:hypothetical protein